MKSLYLLANNASAITLLENPQITHTKYTSIQSLHSTFLIYSPSLCTAHLTGEKEDKGEEALIYFLRDLELSDQGVVCLQTHQILKRPKTESKQTKVPFKIHLCDGSELCECVFACPLCDNLPLYCILSLHCLFFIWYVHYYCYNYLY